MAKATDPYALEDDDPFRAALIDGLDPAAPDPFTNPPGTGETGVPGPGGTTPPPAPPPMPPTTPPAPTPPTGDIAIGLDPWFQANPFPDGGTQEQQQAWRDEAAKHGGTTMTPAPTPGPALGLPGDGKTMTTGWDMTKWNDPTHTSVKYLAGRMMASLPPTEESLGKVADYLRSQGYTVNYTGGDTMTLSGKEIQGTAVIDAIQGLKGGSPMWNWLDAGSTDASGKLLSGGGLSPAGAGVPGTGATLPGASASTTAFDDFYRNLLTQYLGRDPNAVSLEDPALKNASEAHRRSLERTNQSRRAAVAERLSADGIGDSGAMDSAIERGWRDLGNDQSEFDANLVMSERDRARQQLTQLLQMGAGILTADQERALREQLAAIQNQQYYDQLGFQIGDRDAYWNWMNVNGML